MNRRRRVQSGLLTKKMFFTNSLNALGVLSRREDTSVKDSGLVGFLDVCVCVCDFCMSTWSHTALLWLLNADRFFHGDVCVYTCACVCVRARLALWLWVNPNVYCSFCRYFLRHSGLDLGDACRFPVWFYSPVKKKRSWFLGVPVAAATHTCKEKSYGYRIWAPISCCKKNPLSLLLNIWFHESGTVSVRVIFLCSKRSIPVHPIRSSVASFSFWHIIFLPYFNIYFSMCVPNPSRKPHCFLTPCFREDCAWVRTVIYFYSTVYLSTILNFVVTKWSSCVVYGAVLSHIVRKTFVCIIDLWLYVQLSILYHILWLFPKQAKALPLCTYWLLSLKPPTELSEMFFIFFQVLGVFFFF